MNRLFCALPLAFLTAACGGGKSAAQPGLGDGGTTYTATTTTQQFIDQVLGAECEHYVHCGYLPDQATCLQYFNTMMTPSTSSLAYSIDQGRTTISTSNLPACLAAISSSACTVSEASTASVTTACSDIVAGTISSGGDCIDNDECKSGLECDRGTCTASCCAGVCVATKPKSDVGGACTSDSTCIDNAYCKQSYNSTSGTITGTCQARLAVGMACIDYNGCLGSARCVGTTGSKTCVALAKDGAACSSTGVSCENSASSYCDPVKGTCQPRIKDNAPCTIPDGGIALTAGCLNFSECKNGVCKRLPKTGEACSNPDAAVVVDECLLVGKCVDGTCQADPSKTLCTVAVAKAAQADAGARD